VERTGNAYEVLKDLATLDERVLFMGWELNVHSDGTAFLNSPRFSSLDALLCFMHHDTFLKEAHQYECVSGAAMRHASFCPTGRIITVEYITQICIEDHGSYWIADMTAKKFDTKELAADFLRDVMYDYERLCEVAANPYVPAQDSAKTIFLIDDANDPRVFDSMEDLRNSVTIGERVACVEARIVRRFTLQNKTMEITD
jgi:hypothetical protein